LHGQPPCCRVPLRRCRYLGVDGSLAGNRIRTLTARGLRLMAKDGHQNLIDSTGLKARCCGLTAASVSGGIWLRVVRGGRTPVGELDSTDVAEVYRG